MHKSFRLFIIITLLSLLNLLGGCSRTRNIPNTESLAGLQALANTTTNKMLKKKKANVRKIRETALKEIALSLGAQSGLAWKAKHIDDKLVQQAAHLDAIYNFSALILEHNILPPVLLEGRNTLNLADAQTIRISDRTYKVAKQAHFVTTPPNWRQYLWMDFKTPEKPHASLLPRNQQERKVWREYVARGWANGVEQANTILEENVARIKEDFAGMVLYRKLLAMNMVSPPYVSHTDLGVTGDAEEMRIDDKVLRITALPALNINSKEWRAAVSRDEEALEQFRHLEKLANNTEITISNKTWQSVIAPVNG